MNINKAAISSVAVITMLSACASPQLGTPGYVTMQEADRQTAIIKQVQDSISNAPAWYKQPPVDMNSIYAAGSELSSDMQLSMDMATLSSKRALASQISNRLSSKMKEFAVQVGSSDDPQVNREIERVTKNVVTEVNLAGVVRERSEIIPQGRLFRSYVLLRYPLGDTNRMLVEQMKRSSVLGSKLLAAEAYKDLEREIEYARN